MGSGEKRQSHPGTGFTGLRQEDLLDMQGGAQLEDGSLSPDERTWLPLVQRQGGCT